MWPNGFYFIDKYKTISDLGPGKITLNGGGCGKVKVCNEYSDIIANYIQTIALKVTCGVIMSDYTALYLEYYGRIVPTKTGGRDWIC